MNRIALTLVAAAILSVACSAQDAVRTASPSISAQDATIAAAKHYKVEFENDLVRVVRVTYGPHQKSPMHEHLGNAVVIVVLKGGARMHSINEDGTSTDGRTEQAGAVRFVPSRPAFKHSSENVTDFPLETIRVELKAPQPCNDKPAAR
jgi:oxalate decarboxylase/phosphoglucose isomerase-like protein (cupin superfamily)